MITDDALAACSTLLEPWADSRDEYTWLETRRDAASLRSHYSEIVTYIVPSNAPFVWTHHLEAIELLYLAAHATRDPRAWTELVRIAFMAESASSIVDPALVRELPVGWLPCLVLDVPLAFGDGEEESFLSRCMELLAWQRDGDGGSDCDCDRSDEYREAKEQLQAWATSTGDDIAAPQIPVQFRMEHDGDIGEEQCVTFLTTLTKLIEQHHRARVRDGGTDQHRQRVLDWQCRASFGIETSLTSNVVAALDGFLRAGGQLTEFKVAGGSLHDSTIVSLADHRIQDGDVMERLLTSPALTTLAFDPSDETLWRATVSALTRRELTGLRSLSLAQTTVSRLLRSAQENEIAQVRCWLWIACALLRTDAPHELDELTLHVPMDSDACLDAVDQMLAGNPDTMMDALIPEHIVCCTTQCTRVHHTCTSRSLSTAAKETHGIRSITLACVGDEQCVERGLALLDRIGTPITALTLRLVHTTVDIADVANRVAAACPRLRSLCFDGFAVQRDSLDLFTGARDHGAFPHLRCLALRRLTLVDGCEPLVRLASALGDMTRPISRCLEEIGFTLEDASSSASDVLIPTFTAMLALNSRLQWCGFPGRNDLAFPTSRARPVDPEFDAFVAHDKTVLHDIAQAQATKLGLLSAATHARRSSSGSSYSSSVQLLSRLTTDQLAAVLTYALAPAPLRRVSLALREEELVAKAKPNDALMET